MKRFSKRFSIVAACAFAVFAALGVWAFFIEPDRLVVREYDLRLKNWSPEADGLKIVAVSDIHGGSNFIDEAKIRQVVEKVNAQDADIIVLLGDFVSERAFDRRALKMPMEAIAENLKGLRAKHGVYTVLGNHDNAWNSSIVRRELERVGFRVLENEVAVLPFNGERLRIVGMPDALRNQNTAQYRRDVLDALARSGSSGGATLALTHNPDVVTYFQDQSPAPDFDLLLAGHTHGGQCRFPLVGAPLIPSEFGQKYAAGHVRDGEYDVFVTTGVGTSILPVRFNIPPEISVLRIYKQ